MDSSLNYFYWRTELKNADVASIGEDVVLFKNLSLFPAFNYPFKSDIFIQIVCIKGFMKLKINIEEYCIQAPSVFTILSNQIIQFDKASKDFSAQFLLLSNDFLNSLLSGPQERFPLFLSVVNNPYMQLDDDGLESMLAYFKLFLSEIKKESNPYRLETMRHLIQAGFYGTGYQYHKLLEEKDKTKHEILTEDFINLVKNFYTEQREVGFYANKLHLTPKYLSKIIKVNTGKSANNWIDEFVILEAKALLKSTNMNVQQISDHLNFPSQSFFGKYFKRKVGVSPKEFCRV